MSTRNELNAKIEYQWKVVSRIDNYISVTNAKAALLVGFNTFVLGGFLVKAREILLPLAVAPQAYNVALGLIAATGILCVLSLWLTLTVVQPILTSNKQPGDYHSRVFFGDISEVKSANAYVDQIAGSNFDELLSDIGQQTHVVAGIAARKFKRLRLVTRIAIFCQIPVLLALLLITLFVPS